MWKKISKGLLFCAGMASSITAGHLFYIERYPSGLALFAMTALFLFFAMAEVNITSGRQEQEDDFLPGGEADFRKAVGELAAAVADNAVTFRDGKASFTIADDHGNPLAGAAVTLDKQETRNTDRNGLVQFTTTRGAHTLDVYAPGFAPFTMEVVV